MGMRVGHSWWLRSLSEIPFSLWIYGMQWNENWSWTSCRAPGEGTTHTFSQPGSQGGQELLAALRGSGCTVDSMEICINGIVLSRLFSSLHAYSSLIEKNTC